MIEKIIKNICKEEIWISLQQNIFEAVHYSYRTLQLREDSNIHSLAKGLGLRIYRYKTSVITEQDFAHLGRRGGYLNGCSQGALSFIIVSRSFVGKSSKSWSSLNLSNHAPFVWARFRMCLVLFAFPGLMDQCKEARTLFWLTLNNMGKTRRKITNRKMWVPHVCSCQVFLRSQYSDFWPCLEQWLPLHWLPAKEAFVLSSYE